MSTRKLLKYSISVATARHSESIVSVTNEAFMADTFFKKAEYFLRFDLATVQKMISDQNSYFLIATTEESEEICGSIFFHLDTKQIENQRMIAGKFSAVSVPNKFAKQGIGRALVKAVEEKIVSLAKDIISNSTSDISTDVFSEMGVINQREDLFPWYEMQGYKTIGKLPHDEELARIVKDGVDIYCVLMRKQLLLD